jgi:hypothetical protein
MSYLLTSMGALVRTDRYQIDFAGTRFSSTPNKQSSVYIYRPLSGPGYFARGQGLQPGVCVQPLVFAGTVVGLVAKVPSAYNNCVSRTYWFLAGRQSGFQNLPSNPGTTRSTN